MLARESASGRLKPLESVENTPIILPFRRSLLALVGRKTNRGQRSAFPQNLPWLAPLILAIRVLHSRDTSTIDLPSALAETGAYSPDSAFHGTLARAAAPYHDFLRQGHLSLACHLLPKNTKLALGRGAPSERHHQQSKPPPRLNRPAESRRQPVGVSSRVTRYQSPWTIFGCRSGHVRYSTKSIAVSGTGNIAR